jgi:phosphoribosylaminoimidazolecarboxamide formyltransferase/IMP cyclohydrolase
MTALSIGRALLSVSDKSGLAEFAVGLARHGVKIVSTGGTADVLRRAGVSVRDVSEITGYPELFAGRVKTLHPAIHGGILYRRGLKEDEDQRHRHGVVSIDLVCVNLYPFENTIAKADVTDAEAIEQIDIGGPAMIRAAAKNHESVLVVTDPDQYAEVRAALDQGPGSVRGEMARRYAARAFQRTADYDASIARYLEKARPSTVGAMAAGAGTGGSDTGGAHAAGAPPAEAVLPEQVEWRFRRVQTLRYGENPGQEGALYAPPGDSALGALTQVRGKTLSFNNLLDVEGALSLLHEFEETAAVVVKHRNPSGVAVAADPAGAIGLARDGDSLSAFGGILGMNRPLDAAALRAVGTFFYEVVLAPSIVVEDEALSGLRKNLIVLEVPNLLRGAAGPIAARTLLGGLLTETRPGPPRFEGWTHATKRAPTETERRDLEFAWRVARHVVSNAIVIARDGRTLGIGAGQSSRVDAVHLALMKAKRAGHDVRGAVLASDAFFPFADSVETAASAGITAIAQPGGSVRDAESVAAAERAGLAMVFTHERCFLH